MDRLDYKVNWYKSGLKHKCINIDQLLQMFLQKWETLVQYAIYLSLGPVGDQRTVLLCDVTLAMLLSLCLNLALN